ncbi:MAG: serine hydrolase [Cyanobacteria bacterium J06598_3]
MALGLSYASRLLTLATAYKAKLLCSGLFVANRTAPDLLTQDLAVDSLAPLKYVQASIDNDKQLVTTRFLGLGDRTALYRPGLGSTLIFNATPATLREQGKDFVIWSQQHPRRHQELPATVELPTHINADQLNQTIKNAFTEQNSARLKRTRAIVILHKGSVITERYAKGFSAHTPLLGWSMTKSVINALIGILVQQGTLSLSADHLLPEWRSPNDPRRHITLDQLLRMSSGLSFSEDYASPLADATTMLFQRGDRAHYAAHLPLSAPPDTQFAYASGTTVLLCKIIKEALNSSLTDCFSFPQRALFDKLGMASAILEPDEAGTFTGSSFMYATARDWAKLGLLYLQNGCYVVNGQPEQLLPTNWVAYSTGHNPTTPYYGAHFWKGVPLSFSAQKPVTRQKQTHEIQTDKWPKDAYLASGYQGQFVTVVPSCELVVVRLGLSQRRHSWDHEQFIFQIVQAVSPQPA